MWSYVDLAGTSTDLSFCQQMLDTGVSTIQVSTYSTWILSSCEVTENGGSNRTYTAVMADTNPDTSE